MYNTETEQWECISEYFEQDGECYEIPDNGFYDVKTKKVKCLKNYELIGGLCVKPKAN